MSWLRWQPKALNDAGTHNAWWDAAKQKANLEELALVLGVVVATEAAARQRVDEETYAVQQAFALRMDRRGGVG